MCFYINSFGREISRTIQAVCPCIISNKQFSVWPTCLQLLGTIADWGAGDSDELLVFLGLSWGSPHVSQFHRIAWFCDISSIENIRARITHESLYIRPMSSNSKYVKLAPDANRQGWAISHSRWRSAPPEDACIIPLEALRQQFSGI